MRTGQGQRLLVLRPLVLVFVCSPERVLLAGLIASFASACSPYLHSPPARLVPLEAAKALAKGDLAFQGALGGGAAILGPANLAGTFQARYGFGKGLEGSAEAGFATIFPRGSAWNTDVTHSLFAARAGFKYEVASWFALQAGVGGGASAGGGFISPDVGGIFSYQGEKIVPFLAGGINYSWPLGPNPIVFTNQQGDQEELRPVRTFGAYGNLGLRIPYSHRDPKSPRSAVIIAYRFVGAGFDEPATGRARYVYHLGVLALDFVLRRDRVKGRWKLR